MRIHLLAAAAIACLAGAAGAVTVAETIVQDLTNQGYTSIEIHTTSAGLTVEAKNATTELHQVYDPTTGALIAEGSEPRGQSGGITGVETASADSTGDMAEAAGGSDDGAGHDVGDDHGSNGGGNGGGGEGGEHGSGDN